MSMAPLTASAANENVSKSTRENSFAGQRQLLLGFVLTAIVIFCVIAAIRGPWMDEYWTLFMGSHSAPFEAVLRDRWLQDAHPPLFSFLNWLIDPLVAQDVTVRRFLNLIPLLLVVWHAAFAWKHYSEARPFLFAFAIAVLATYPAFNSFTEYRSYFMQACIGFMLLVQLYILNLLEDQPLLRRPPFVLTTAILFFSFNLHYISAFISGIFIAVFIAYWLIIGQFKPAKMLIISATICAIPLVSIFAYQRTFMTGLPQSFWIHTDAWKSVLYLGLVTVRGAGMNAILVMAAFASFCLLFIKIPSLRNYVPQSANVRYMLLVALGCVLVAIALFFINLKTPIIVDRYLNLVTLAVTAGLSAAAAAAFSNSRILRLLFAANAAVVIASTAFAYSKDERWDFTANAIQHAKQACDDLEVTAWTSQTDWPFPNNEAVRRLAYEKVAARHGFHVAFEERGLMPKGQAGPCGRAVWLEHVPKQYDLMHSHADFVSVMNAPIDLSHASDIQWAKGDSGVVLLYKESQ